MSKKLFLPAISAILLVLLIPIALRLTIPTETATVKFKEAIIETPQPNGGVTKQDELFGEVTKKDKYVVIKPEGDGRELVFTWDQIKSITESRQVRSKQVDEVVDWIEFVSKMGIIAAIVIFLVGLYQYQQGQKWKQEEFLATAVKEFMASTNAGNARLMLDVLHLYKDGIDIKFQDAPPERITKEEIIDALDTDPYKKFDQKAIEMRDCFDSYFNHLERFEHYIENDLVSKNSVYTYLNYQIILLSNSGKLKDEDRERILRYAEFYEFPGIKALLQRYKKKVRKRNPIATQPLSPVREGAPINDNPNAPTTDDRLNKH